MESRKGEKIKKWRFQEGIDYLFGLHASAARLKVECPCAKKTLDSGGGIPIMKLFTGALADNERHPTSTARNT